MNNAQRIIKKIVYDFVDPNEYEIFIFGSRAMGTAKKFSDFDIGIKGKKPLSFKTLASIKNALEESDLPFTVDVVDFSLTSRNFKKNALKKIKKL